MHTSSKRSVSYFYDGMYSLWELLGEKKKHFMILAGVLVAIQVAQLATPALMKFVFDMLPSVIERGINNDLLLLFGALMGISVLTLFLAHRVRDPLFLEATVQRENFWPVAAQSKLLELSERYHEEENTGRKIEKIHKGCDRSVDTLMHMYWGILPLFFYLCVNVVVVTYLDWRLALIFFLPFLPVAILSKRLYDRSVPDWDAWNEHKEIANGLFCQSIINVGTVQGFVQEDAEEAKLGDIREKMANIDIAIHRKLQRHFFAYGLVLHGGFLGAFFYGVILAIHGEITLGTLVYLVTTGNASMGSLHQVVQIYSQVMQDLVSVKRMKRLLDEKPDVRNEPEMSTPQRLHGALEFRDVTFRYGGNERRILDKLSITIAPGKMLALVGVSGSGKTTVIKLLARVYDPSDGEVTLDGIDIRKYDRNWYRRLFAVVKQNVDIFDATLGENIRYGYQSATDEEMLEAVHAAHLSDSVDDPTRFTEGLDTQVGEQGVRLSGGEQQRVGIARAYLSLLGGAKVLILDEATSNLDSEAERAIQEMIARLRQKRDVTVVAIAHRLSTIKHADHICVLEHGRIIEEGDHARLLSHNGLYARLVRLQEIGQLRK